MSNEADVAMMLELEQKIEQRVLSIISKHGNTVAQAVSYQLVSDENFIREITRRVGSKMTNVY